MCAYALVYVRTCFARACLHLRTLAGVSEHLRVRTSAVECVHLRTIVCLQVGAHVCVCLLLCVFECVSYYIFSVGNNLYMYVNNTEIIVTTLARYYVLL